MGSPAELVAHLPDDSPFMNTSYTLQSPSWTLYEHLGASEAERRSWLPGSG